MNVSLQQELGQGDMTCSSFELLILFIRFVLFKIKTSGLKTACANPENDESVRTSKLGRKVAFKTWLLEANNDQLIAKEWLHETLFRGG